jgi:hypothetical protein
MKASEESAFVHCIRCEREIETGETIAIQRSGRICEHCLDKERELERRADREWLTSLWEDGPWWVKLLLLILIPAGFWALVNIGPALVIWPIGQLLRIEEHLLERAGFGGGLAVFLTFCSPFILIFLLSFVGVHIQRIRRSSHA